jgi:molybdopterin adenylyltransferase
MTQTLRAAVLTISDSVSAGKRRDGSGPAVAELLKQNGWTVVHTQALADDMAVIAATLRELVAKKFEGIFTTGGTGIAERDVTPEATRKVLTREIPGLGEAMRRAGSEKTATAILSRSLGGIAGGSLIVNLPGSPKGAIDSLQAVLPVLAHAAELIAGQTEHK